MSLVTVASVKDFANIFPDTDAPVMEAIGSAEELVIDYLGFNPASADYLSDAVGLGDGDLYLLAFPVAGDITVDGTVYTEADYKVEQNVVTIPDTAFTYKDKIPVEYTAGYTTVPALILHTITQIAALLLTERGNIGISGMSDANTGSRTFISYTNFDKYLKNLKRYRLRKPLV